MNLFIANHPDNQPAGTKAFAGQRLPATVELSRHTVAKLLKALDAVAMLSPPGKASSTKRRRGSSSPAGEPFSSP